MTLISSIPAISPGNTSSFLAAGGTGPYSYSVLPNGAGGSIDSAGLYTAPAVSPSSGAASDTVQAIDSLGAIATNEILIGAPLWLVCDIIQRELGLADGQVYLWDQKIDIPKDEKLYVAVTVASLKPFGVSTNFNSSGPGLDAIQTLNMQAKLDINILSRGPAARDRKEEIVLALSSVYSEQQQNANSFYVSRLSSSFVNLSEIDGSAIPYRYVISANIQYVFKKVKAAQYFDTFSAVEVTTEA